MATKRNDPDVACMTAGQINKALDRSDKLGNELIAEFIAAGRGHERFSAIAAKDDDLSRRYIAAANAQYKLKHEVSRRYGPGAPYRLPRGFGPLPGARCKKNGE